MSQILYHDYTLLNIKYIGVPEVFNYFSCLHIHVYDNAFDKTLFKNVYLDSFYVSIFYAGIKRQ